MDQVIQEVYRLKNMAAAHESATQTRIERMMEKCKNGGEISDEDLANWNAMNAKLAVTLTESTKMANEQAQKKASKNKRTGALSGEGSALLRLTHGGRVGKKVAKGYGRSTYRKNLKELEADIDGMILSFGARFSMS